MTESTPDLHSFEHKGETYTFEKSLDEVRSPRFLRLNRRRDELDLTFTIIEQFGGAKVVEVVDSMDPDEFRAFSADLDSAVGASLGK